MKTVLVFRRALLPMSETFVRQQALGLRDWEATLVGHHFVTDGLDLSGLRAQLVSGGENGLFRRLGWLAFSKVGWPVPVGVRALDQLDAELIHVHFATDAVAAWPWLRRLHLPVVVTLHGYDINTHPEWWIAGNGGHRQRRYPSRLRALSREPRVSFIAVSEAIRQRAMTAFDIPANKIEVLHIGVDNTVFVPGPIMIGHRAPKVLFVGRLVEKKAPDVLIHAMQQVQRSIPAAELVVIGDGPLRQRSEQLALDLKVNARFMGAQPNSVVRQMMDETRVFCLPSITAANGDAEGLPISVLEAQACGVPVVTSAVGGRDEGIRDGVTGFAFAEGDHAALAGHLLKLLTDDVLATDMGLKATRHIAERFSLADCTRALERRYGRIANDATT